MATKKNGAEPAGYAEAMAEIESILRELDSPNVDVDVLATKVERASALIAWCNERISSAELVVENLVADLSAVDDAADEGPDE